MRVKLSDVTKYAKGTQINRDDLIENGQYIYLNGGINPSGRWNDANVKGNTVTISEGGNSSGYVNYMTEPFWCGAHCYYLFDGPKNTRYLYYALKSQQERLFSIRSGACMPNIKKADLGKFEFEFDRDERKQNKIVTVLSKIEAVIGERKRELELLDELVKSRFVEMFGDPVINNKAWPMDKLKNVTTKIGSGATPRGGKASYQDDGISLIRSMNVHDGEFEYKDLAHITDDQAKQLSNVVVELHDVFINITGASVARSCVVPDDILPARVNQHVCIIRCLGEKLNYTFACNMFLNSSFKTVLLAIGESSGATRQAITKQQLENLEVILPPIELQKRFADFIKCVDKSKLIIQKNLDELETLNKALMQKYFGGNEVR